MTRLRTGAAGGLLTAHDAALNSPANAAKPSPEPFWGETLKIIGVSVGLLLAVQLGSFIVDALHAYMPWLLMLCYAVPILAVAAIFGLIGRLF